MAVTDPFDLPEDVLVVPVETLPTSVRDHLEWDPGDHAVTRPRSRTPSKIVDARSASLLQGFRSPRTIVDAVLVLSGETDTAPEPLLEEAYPIVRDFIHAG